MTVENAKPADIALLTELRIAYLIQTGFTRLLSKEP